MQAAILLAKMKAFTDYEIDKVNDVAKKYTEELQEIGAKQAFFKLKEIYPNVCLVHLYALEGAVQNTGYNRLSEDTKKDLKAFSDFLRS